MPAKILPAQIHSSRRRSVTSLLASSDDGGPSRPQTAIDATPPKKKKKKRKKKPAFVINPNLADTSSVSSDGILENKIKEREALREDSTQGKSNLGVPSRRKMKDATAAAGGGGGSGGGRSNKKKLSAKAAQIQRQRTAGGTVDSSRETVLSAPPDEQNVQVQVAKRGNKTVTMVLGLTSTMDDRKALLKEMKRKLGGGGTLVEGVLELQGSHGDVVLAIIKSKGFAKAKLFRK